MSTTEYVIIAVSVGIIIIGVPLIAFFWQRNIEHTLEVSIDETTPLRQKAKYDENETEEAITFDASTIINRILTHGIILHTTKGPKKVAMHIDGTQLRWHSSVSGKKYMIDLTDVKYVESGKKTHNFRKSASSQAPDRHCFSLVCQATTVDLEAGSASDRDVLVDNFHNVIERIIADRNENDV